MEKGLAYKVECFYDNYCVRDSNDKVSFVTRGELYDMLDKTKRDYSLYRFINKSVIVNDELVLDYKLWLICDYSLTPWIKFFKIFDVFI